MSGIIRGKVDCLSNTGSTANNCQEAFKNCYDFFASHPNMTLISRNSGSSSAAGDIAFWDQSNRFRHNAWAVFRMNPTAVRPYPVYFQIQYGESGGGVNFGNAPGSPALVGGSDVTNNTAPHLGIQVAIGEGGTENPFKGTMNAGSPNDTRANPLWGVPTGGVRAHLFPRTNNPGGPALNVTQKHDFCHMHGFQNGAIAHRYHFIADDDSFLFMLDEGDTNTYDSMNYSGIFVPRTGLSLTYPFVMLGLGYDSSGTVYPLPINQEFGNPTLVALSRRDGGVVAGATSNGVRNVFVDRFQNIISNSQQPNLQFAAPEYEEFTIPLYTNETSAGAVAIAHLGHITFIKESANLSTNDTNVALTRAAFGDNTLTSVKTMVPWGGLTPPKSNSTRGGTLFTRARVASDD